MEIVISKGNLPLHGTNAFVSIEIIFSLGESIILHPTTPAALQPKPIHIVNACFSRINILDNHCWSKLSFSNII